MLLRLFILIGVLAAVRSAVTIDDCPTGLNRTPRLRAFGNSCYVFVMDHEREFDSAERECEARGGRLVIIRDLATQQFLYNTLRNEFHNGGVLWIGLTDQNHEGRFTWVDGSPATFTYWASGQPGLFGSLEDCVAMDMDDGGRWHDYRCSDLLFIHYQHTFVCEYPVVKHTTTRPRTTTPTMPKPTTTPPPTTIPTTAMPKPTTTPPPTTIPTTAMPKPSTTTTTTTPQPTTTTASAKPTTHHQHPSHQHPDHSMTNHHPPKTTAAAAGTTDCPPFECSLDCGFSGYQVDGNSCLLCQCEN